MNSAKYYIEKLDLKPHPEGGFFKEIFKSEEKMHQDHLPERFGGHRHFLTSIYFLLETGNISKFHKIKSDELWYFHEGVSCTVVTIDDNGKLEEHKVGLNIANGEQPQAVVKQGLWFGAYVNKPDSYSLVGCAVAPGFDFLDFEMGDRENLIKQFPHHKEIITKLT